MLKRVEKIKNLTRKGAFTQKRRIILNKGKKCPTSSAKQYNALLTWKLMILFTENYTAQNWYFFLVLFFDFMTSSIKISFISNLMLVFKLNIPWKNCLVVFIFHREDIPLLPYAVLFLFWAPRWPEKIFSMSRVRDSERFNSTNGVDTMNLLDYGFFTSFGRYFQFAISSVSENRSRNRSFQAIEQKVHIFTAELQASMR